jgi:hypothetical protein
MPALQKFAVDFLGMLLLFDSIIDHNGQAAPAPWAGKKLSIKEQSLLQQNQIVLLKLCLHQNEDQAWKFFGNRKFGQLGWSVCDLDSLWGSNVQYFCQFNAVVSSTYKDYRATYKGEKHKELIWIDHFCCPTIVSPQVSKMKKDICFKHKNSGLFVCQFTHKETQEYINLFHITPRYEWLWLGKNY